MSTEISISKGCLYCKISNIANLGGTKCLVQASHEPYMMNFKDFKDFCFSKQKTDYENNP